MILLGGSSAISILVGVLTAKVWALRVGPSGVGLQSLLLSFAGLASVVVTMGGGPALVRRGAQLIESADEARFGSVRRAAWICVLILGLTTSVGFVMAGSWLRMAVVHEALPLSTLLALGAITTALAAQSVSVGTLNAYHRVRVLARVNGLISLVTAMIGLMLILPLGARAIPAALAFGAVGAAAVAAATASRNVPRASPASVGVIAKDSVELLRFGIPYTASTLLSSGVVLLIPVLVLNALGQAPTGYYRAASTISVAYVGFILVALAQDFFPRASVLRHRPGDLAETARAQQRLVLCLGTPFVLIGVALARLLLPAAYSGAFMPAAAVFEWLMLANLFRFSSWTLSFVQLARGRTAAYFLTEAVYGVVTIVGTLIALAEHSLAGVGVAFLFGYAVYYVTVLAVVCRDMGYREERRYIAALILVLLVGLGIRSVPAPSVLSLGEAYRLTLAVAGSLACAAILFERHEITKARESFARARRLGRPAKVS